MKGAGERQNWTAPGKLRRGPARLWLLPRSGGHAGAMNHAGIQAAHRGSRDRGGDRIHGAPQEGQRLLLGRAQLAGPMTPPGR